jgi:hypothetical protein
MQLSILIRASGDDGMRPEVKAFAKAVPRRREVRRREYDPPGLEDTDVNADDEEVVQKKPGQIMGQGP